MDDTIFLTGPRRVGFASPWLPSTPPSLIIGVGSSRIRVEWIAISMPMMGGAYGGEGPGNGGHGLVKGATVFGLAVPMIVIVPLVMLMSLSTIPRRHGPGPVRHDVRRGERAPVRRPRGSNGRRTSPRTIRMVTVRRIVTAIRITIVRRSSITR